MGTSSGRENAPLIKLLNNPQQFDFFQAIRLLERAAMLDDNASKYHPIGQDYNPKDEIVRFKVPATLSFPSNTIDQLKNKKNTLEMFVTFIGLIGANGVLPDHYTEMLIERLHAKDNTLQDFFDLFHHRIISLFYRAWEKYRFYIGYERSKQKKDKTDPFSYALSCMLGNGTIGLQNRLSVPDEALIFYSGLTHQPRSASALERILGDYFNLPLNIEQFQSEWLYLNKKDRTRIASNNSFNNTSKKPVENDYNLLSINAVLGSKIRNVQSKFRIRIGPISYRTFKRLLPSGDMLKPLHELTRYYIGIDLNFDVQLVLEATEIPRFRLTHKNSFCLGWNTWIKTKPFQHNTNDLILTIHN